MMDGYMEYLVKRGATRKDFLVKGICVWVVLVLCMLSWMFGTTPVIKIVLFVLTIGMIAFSWFYVFPRTEVEYEYLYCDKTISVDVIYSKSSRKSLASYELDRIDIIAPLGSHRLDEYKNKKMEVKDYSSGMDSDLHKPYVLIYTGNTKVILDLPEEFVKMVQNNGPRKVFTD